MCCVSGAYLLLEEAVHVRDEQLELIIRLAERDDKLCTAGRWGGMSWTGTASAGVSDPGSVADRRPPPRQPPPPTSRFKKPLRVLSPCCATPARSRRALRPTGNLFFKAPFQHTYYRDPCARTMAQCHLTKQCASVEHQHDHHHRHDNANHHHHEFLCGGAEWKSSTTQASRLLLLVRLLTASLCTPLSWGFFGAAGP